MAQRFTPTMERTIRFLNDQARSARFYAVELVRFRGGGIEAFEARSVVKPDRSRASSRGSTNEETLLNRIRHEGHRNAVARLLEFCRAQDLALEWGSTGVSVRVRAPDVSEPVSIGWLFPPSVSGWIGLRDLSLGYDIGSSRKKMGGDTAILDRYVNAIGDVRGVEALSAKGLKGHRVPDQVLVQEFSAITDAIAALASRIAERA